MLKFLRKYNTWIMVIAGTLLMIAWLLSQTISELGKMSARRQTFKVEGSRAPAKALDLAYREHAALQDMLGRGVLEEMFRIENGEHWYLLTREAAAAGLNAGPTTGRDYAPKLASQITERIIQRMFSPTEHDRIVGVIQKQLDAALEQPGRYRLTSNELATALAKVKGVQNMRGLFYTLPRFSDRRLALTYKGIEDSVGVDFVFVPSDREINSVKRPSDDAIAAFFEANKGLEPGKGEFGVGYRQPERVKLEWLTINRKAIADAITPDPVEVQKRLLKKSPPSPDMQFAESERQSAEQDLRNEKVDEVLRAADRAIRSEIDKSVRSFPQDGRYWALPADWAAKRPTLERLSELAGAEIRRTMGSAGEGTALPAPAIVRKNEEWLTPAKLGALEGIGRGFARRGDRREMFTDVVLKLKELAGPNDFGLQVGLPSEPIIDGAENRYYFIVTDYRKESAPDSLDEVRAQVIQDMMEIEAYKVLAPSVEKWRAVAVAGGLEKVASPQETPGQNVISAVNLPIEKATVKRDKATAGAGTTKLKQIEHEEFRRAVLDAAAKLDPTKPLDGVAADQLFVAAAIPGSRGIAVAKITALNPVTVERMRSMQNQAVFSSLGKEFSPNLENDPFTFEAMRKRFKVENDNVKSKDGKDSEE